MEGQVIRYSGENYLPGIPTRDDIVAENDGGLTAILKDALSSCQEIPFMAVDFGGSSEKIGEKNRYVLRLYGSLINGQKTVVILTGIQVFFDIRVPEKESADDFKVKIDKILCSTINAYKIVPIRAFPFCGYHTEKKLYLRVFTHSTGDRKKALQAIQDNNFETASDDIFSLHRKIARENGIAISGWSMLSRYSYRKHPQYTYDFHVSVNYFRAVEDLKLINDRFPLPALVRDRTLILTWDIETQSRELGEFAEVHNKENNVFMICITLHWKDDPKSLKQICLIDLETAPDPRWITVVCGNQPNLLKAFALCWGAFQPDIQLGDFKSSEKIQKWDYYGKLEVNSKNNFRKKKGATDGEEEEEFRVQPVKVKICPEEDFISTFLKIPGCVPIDVRVCFKKLYPRAEVDRKSSLAFYLKKCGLDGKADMPYNKMWRIYSEAKAGATLRESHSSTMHDMHEVAYYCIIDALRCQELMVKRNVINDYREVTSLAYVSFFDSHYRANGMKVRNLVGAYATKRDILFSMRQSKNTEKSKYPGAYVYPPKKGIETARPVTGLDFASLYPSLIMTYNLSPEKIILTHGEAVNVRKNGNILHKIEFPFNGRTVQAWSVSHNNQSEKKGLYPIVLEDLYNKRVELKAQLAQLGKKKERLGKTISSAKERGKKVLEGLNSEYSSVCFDYNCLNSKQSALKVYMNTFYGEAGNSISPFFLLELAGGITSAGQYNIGLVAKFVSGKGFRIKYGDTDSLYITCPDKYYEICDRAFNEGKLSKEEYWTEMVNITMGVMKKLRDQVNAYLRIKNGTSYLKMAYEEVLFPVCFTGKKKYFGVPHEGVVNFRPDDLFKKGIDTVKQGQSQLFKFIGEKIIWEAMDINNTRSIHKIVEDTLREAKHKQWDFNDFIVMATWKPKKKNLCVHRFIGRMREKNEMIPDPGERFNYVVVKGPPLYNEEGQKEQHRVGDYMEYADIAKELNMEIDINYYLEKTVGMCAHFINEDDRYQPPPSHKIMQLKDSDEKEKQIDTYSQDEAKKWLKKYIKGL
ncbi:DNA polymerase family B-domain-containing protein [Rhizophagus clarus]|uniref:DNA polymerase n=1 Tax=Rhizophagus clarus TaxID=94130 RepID=A0A8H3LC89_9GLOM|nr:DNA polymerase family B-domain-containing protein [Rhizophagus clarus]